MNYQNEVGCAGDIIARLDEIYSDTEKLAAWLDECRDFEARGWVSIETARQMKYLKDSAYAV